MPTDPSGLAVPGASSRHFVYATLGTVFNTTRQLLKAFIAAIDDGGWSGLVTVGRTNDPARFERPARVAVEQYVPQADVLALADVMAVDSLSRTSPPRATARSLAARLTAGPRKSPSCSTDSPLCTASRTLSRALGGHASASRPDCAEYAAAASLALLNTENVESPSPRSLSTTPAWAAIAAVTISP